MSPTQARDQAAKAARTDWRGALSLARQVGASWFGCQALAWVARFAPAENAVVIAGEAMKAGAGDPDPFLRVAVAAWPLRAMVERGEGAWVRRFLPDVLGRAGDIEHPVRKLDALFLIWQAVFPLGSGPRDAVQRLMLDAAEQADSWKAAYVLRDLVLMLRTDFDGDPGQLVELVPEGKYRRQAARRLQNGRTIGPRMFFW